MKRTNRQLLIGRFIVSGASGAMGRGNKLQSKADQIRAIVRLVKNETIYILVGQQGSAFCEINGVSEEHKYQKIEIYCRSSVFSRG